jgi:cytidine deaminase
METREPSDHEQALYEQAQQAAEFAYVPYSNFPVGAAVRTSSGEVFTGCNIENASFGLTICAERVACTAAIAAGHRSITAVAIHVAGDNGQPCGACRQFLAEFGRNADVVYRSGGATVVLPLTGLLPDSFQSSTLAAHDG